MVGRFTYSTNTERSPLAGYGMGLALSRLYAQYFGGDLTLSSKVGIGTDVSLRTAWLDGHQEHLPSTVSKPNRLCVQPMASWPHSMRVMVLPVPLCNHWRRESALLDACTV